MVLGLTCSFFVFFSLFGISCIYAQAGQTGRYPSEYNLIDADPSCRHPIPSGVCCVGGFTSPQCPLIYNGSGDVDVMAIHPNIQERTDYLMRNMARLYPDFYSSSEWGFGGGSYANDCDKPQILPTTPFYFMSEAVQAARWNSFSGATTYSECARSDYPDGCYDAAQTSHFTCCDYCEYNVWSQCGYKYRTKAMVQLLFTLNAWNDVGSEGIWGHNNVYPENGGSSAHCGMVFNYRYHHQGIGYYPSGSTTMVGIYDTEDWEDHVFPHATHFDWDQNDFTFLVQFFGGKKQVPVIVNDVYLLYNEQMILMDTVISSAISINGTNATSGFFKVNQSKTIECEPYAFIAKDDNGNWWRLPEDERYYFGTVDHPDNLRDGSANCVENHYFYTGNEWITNGADNLTNTNDGCIGCSKVLILEDVYANKDIETTISPTATSFGNRNKMLTIFNLSIFIGMIIVY